MSSLRLALKQSLSEAPSTKSSKKKKNKFIYTPTPFGLSDKELRKLEKQRKAEARANSRSKKGGDGEDKDVDKRLKKRKEKDRMKKKLKEERKLKKIKRKERQDELQRAIEGNGGTEIHIGVGGDGEGGGGLVTGTLKSGVDAKDGDGGGSVSSSTLSSSSSGSSSSSDSDDSSDSSSSSSESSDSDDDSSSSSDSDDDDDENSSDDDSSSEEEGEVKDDDSLDSSSSSGDSSDDTIEAADRETKELFDADLSSDDEKESVKDTAEADDKRRKRRLKKKSKMLKAFKKKDDAANMIATHWKKKKSIGSSAGEKDGTPDTPGDTPNDNNDGDKDFSPEKSAKEDTVSKTVESPSPEILQHIRTMSTKLQRKNIQTGLRVKVRFVKKANINGRLTRKLKWYGGVVAGIANSGRKIKIQYDDGTSEVADFPDKDIIVDDVNNGRHNCGSGGAGIMGGGGGDPGSAFVPMPTSPTKSEEIDDDGVDGESNESEEEVDDTPMDPDSPEKKKVKKKKKKKDTGEERSEENVVQQKKKKKKRASEDRGDDGNSSSLPLGVDDGGLDSGALQRRRRSSNSERSDKGTLSKKKRGSLSDVSERDEMKKSKRRESTSDMSISSNGEQTDTSPIKMKPAPSALSSVPGNDKNDAGAKNVLSEKDEEAVEEGAAEEENLSQDDKSAKVDIARMVHESKGDDKKMPFVQKDDSKDTKEELEKLKPEEGDAAEEKVKKDAPSTNPGIDNTAASSSSGSTCSNSSFVGVAAPIATSVDGNVLDSATDDVKLPSHVDVQVEKGKQTVPGTDEQDTDMGGDDEKVQDETLGPAGKEGMIPKSGSEAEDQESQEKPKKKRGPLSIHIGLPKRKKQEHNQTDSNDADVGAAASELEEPSKKKQKLTVEGVINPSSGLENTVKVDETLDSNNSPLDGEVTPATKGDNDESVPDGEIEEEGEVQEEGGKIEEDGTMEVEPAKTLESNTEHDVPSEPKLSPTTHKKPKLSIHISTKKRKKLQQENKSDETAEAIAEPEQDVANDGTTKQSDAAMWLPLDDADKGAEEKDSTHPPPATLLKEEKEVQPGASPRLEGDKSDNDKKPPSSAGTSTNPSPAPEDAVGTEGGSKYSMARSGRKAAKIAAEKISKKKPRKTSEKKKKEEDPWVQCDRCHKWRHLPASVDLDTLPEHWFCELNTYDAKRNNCEAEEQTPKEVAKEKKRMKKLQKLQELAKADAEAREEAAASAAAMEAQKPKGRKRSQSPKNGSDKETEFDTPEEKTMLDSGARGSKNTTDDDDNANTSGGESPKPLFPKKKRGRPRNVDKEKAAGKGKDEPKQEWVQCEKCEKWRRLPPRISAADLPDVWYCSMNTWDINMATCTAIEDKHELSPSRPAQYNEQSQIPTGFGSSSKLSYRNLIFGSGRLKKSISERMRAQESLFSSQQEEEVDMSMPPTVMYANSNVFFNKSLQKANSLENEAPQTSIFDIASSSRVWQELNNNAPVFHMQSNAAYNAVGLSKFCQPNGSLNQEAVDTLKAMLYFSLAGGKMLVPHEILLEVQCQDWNYGVPAHWMELRSLCTIEITTFILDELIKDGLVEMISDPKSLSSLENAFYRRRTEALPAPAP